MSDLCKLSGILLAACLGASTALAQRGDMPGGPMHGNGYAGLGRGGEGASMRSYSSDSNLASAVLEGNRDDFTPYLRHAR